MDARPVAHVALHQDHSAAHGVSRGVPAAAVDDDFPGVHGIAGGILGVTEYLHPAVVHIGAQGIAGNAVNRQPLAGQAAGNIALAHDVRQGNLRILTGMNLLIQLLKGHLCRSDFRHSR